MTCGCATLMLLIVAGSLVPASAPSTAPAQGAMIRARGVVLDPTGKPISGARITIPSPVSWTTRVMRKVLSTATSGPDGRFEISAAKADLSPFSTGGGSPGENGWKQAQVVASADGFGLAFARWDQANDAGDIVLKLLADDVPIDARVVDLEGLPVEGVRVHISEIQPIDEAVLIAGYKENPDHPPGDLVLWNPLHAAGRDAPIITGKDGRFRVAGIGRERKIAMYLSGERIGFTRVEAATKAMPPITRTVDQPIGSAPKFVTYGAVFDYTAVPGRTVKGVVRDAATKQPMAGVLVKSTGFAGPFQGYDPSGMIQCVTDAQGSYTLNGFPKGQGNSIGFEPNDEQPYFQRAVALPDEPGLAPVTIHTELHQGVWITGKVTDLQTAQPAPGRLIYTTYLDNPHALALPEFERTGGAGSLQGDQGRYETKPDGTYRLVAVPGKAIIGVWSLKEGYRKGVGFDAIPVFKEKNFVFRLYQHAPYPQGTNVVREIDVPQGFKSVTCDLQLDPGETIRLTLTDPDGTPTAAKRLSVRGQEPENYGGPWFKQADSAAVNLTAFGPKDERSLFVIDEQRKLGRAVRVKAAELPERKLTVQLQPLAEVKGRLLNADGDPLPKLSVEARESKGDGRTVRSIQSGDDGRFTTTLPAGCEYYMMVDRGPYAGALVKKQMVPESGGKIDIGEVKLDVQMR